MTSCAPLPEIAADCGLPVALSVTDNAAVRVPAAAGVNMITILQLVPAASEELQVLF